MTESITIKETEEVQKPKDSGAHKKWYKSLWFWLVIGAMAILAAGLIWFFGFYRPSQATEEETLTQEKNIADDWSDVAGTAEDFAAFVERAKTVDDFSSLSRDAQKVTKVAGTAKNAYDQQTIVQNDAYVDALDAIVVYIEAVQAVLDTDIAEIQGTDFDSLKEKATTAQEATNTFIDKTDYLDTKVVPSFFDAHEKLKSLFDTYTNTTKQEEEAKKKAEEEARKQKEQVAKDDSTVENVAVSFSEDFIVGDATGMKRWMTSSFEAEYDFTRLSSENRSYYAPESFRVIDVVRNSDTRYYVYGRMTQKQVGGDEQYTEDFNLTLMKNGSEWLVDVDAAPAR